jgi:O-antigen ligase
MKLKKKSAEVEVSLEDLYAVKIKSIWQAIKQEHISFWAITGYYFFDYVRPQNIYTWLDVVPWGFMFLLIALFSMLSDRSVKMVKCVENNILLAFFFIVILSGVFAFKPMVSWDAKTEIINWILVYFLTVNIINSEKRFYLFLLGYMIFSFKMSQHGFTTWARRGFSFTQWGLIGAGGYFQNSGEYAIQMLIFGSMSAAFVLALKEKWGRFKKWFFYLMPFTAFMVVLGASSRGSQVGLLVIGLLLMVRVKAGFKIFVTMAVLLTLAYFLLPEEQLARFSDMGDDTNSKTRFAYWAYGWEVIKDHPIFGVGYNNWLKYAYYAVPAGIFDGRIQLPHNIYIEVAAESGFLGLFGFLALIVVAFSINAKTRKMSSQFENKLYYNLTFGFSMGLVGYLVAGTFVTVFYYPFFWVQIALIVAMHNVVRNKVESMSINDNNSQRPRARRGRLQNRRIRN